jgi:hypothetical protein
MTSCSTCNRTYSDDAVEHKNKSTKPHEAEIVVFV